MKLRRALGATAALLAIVLLVAPAVGVMASGVELVSDEFDSASYDGNNGTARFSGPWREIGESDGAGSGRVQVTRSGSCSEGRCLQIVGSATAHGATRTVDLSRFPHGTLSFSLGQNGAPGDGALAARISNDGGRSWITLATFPRQVHIASPEFDISRYASSNTVIAFVTTGGASHVSYIDDVRLTLGYEDPSLDPVSEDPDKGGPPDHADLQGKPQATTTTSTTTTSTVPPPGDGNRSDDLTGAGDYRGDILIGIALQQRNFAPPAWTASEVSAIRASLTAAGLSGAVSGVQALREDLDPVTDVTGAFTRPGTPVRRRFLPTAIFGALLAWATVTGLDRRKPHADPTPD